MPSNTTIKHRRDTAANWAAKSPAAVLAEGEWGIETDTQRAKIGDGTTTWPNLQYVARKIVVSTTNPGTTGFVTGDIWIQQ